jgi:hypothetical protein
VLHIRRLILKPPLKSIERNASVSFSTHEKVLPAFLKATLMAARQALQGARTGAPVLAFCKLSGDLPVDNWQAV